MKFLFDVCSHVVQYFTFKFVWEITSDLLGSLATILHTIKVSPAERLVIDEPLSDNSNRVRKEVRSFWGKLRIRSSWLANNRLHNVPRASPVASMAPLWRHRSKICTMTSAHCSIWWALSTSDWWLLANKHVDTSRARKALSCPQKKQINKEC